MGGRLAGRMGLGPGVGTPGSHAPPHFPLHCIPVPEDALVQGLES